MTVKAGSAFVAKAAFVRVKAIDEEHRIIEGVASSPTTDRVGDVVMPTGAQFTLPLPLLIDHDHKQAVGEVEWAKATEKGIRFRARIAKIDKPGAAKDLTDYAWDLVRSGLRKTVSIGFRVLPGGYEVMPAGGVMFMAWEWFELSLVAVPANPDAQIESFKAQPAAVRQVKTKPVRLESKASLDAKRQARSKRSVVFLSAPADRECKRIEQRIAELNKAFKRLEKQAYDKPFDHDLQEHVQSALKLVEQERSFQKERLVGIGAGLIVVTEKEARAPLVRSKADQVRAAPLATKPAAVTKAKSWSSRPPSDPAASDWSKAADRGLDRVQEVFEKSGVGPDTVIRAATFRSIVGVVMGIANAAYAGVAELQARMAEIEAAGIKFAGVWQRANSYERGSVVTHQGSAWVALKSTGEGDMPGQAAEQWQLMVKAGRDGKDSEDKRKERPVVKVG